MERSHTRLLVILWEDHSTNLLAGIAVSLRAHGSDYTHNTERHIG